MNNLNNKLLELNDLYCSICKNFLNVPIMLNVDIGNVCGRCFSKEPKDDVQYYIPNTALESVIKCMEVPCRYKSEGCSVQLVYNEMFCHEDYCSFKQYNCPARTNCFWRGSLGNLSKHFEGFHPTLLKKADNLVFDIEIDIKNGNSEHSLLVSNFETFLFQLLMDDDNIWCSVCYIGDEDKGTNYEYYIDEISFNQIIYLKNDSRKAILPPSFMFNLDKDRAIHIPLNKVKLYIPESTSNILYAKLNIVGGEPSDQVDENILSHLECPVCSTYMLPPIHQCLTGHNICCKCRPKLNQCPTCRGRIENTRNYALEAVSAKTKYPCINRLFGCNTVLPGSLIEKHEVECKLRTYNCVVQNTSCTWQGKHADLLEHLRTIHKINHNFQTKINFSGNQFFMYTTNYNFMIVCGEVFKIGYKYENNSQTTFWNCRVYGNHNKSKFKFKVTYLNDVGDFMLVKSGLCLLFTADDEFFNHSLAFPQNLSTRVGNTVKCDIIKL